MNPLRRHPNTLHESTGTVTVGRRLGYVLSAIILSALATVVCGTADDQQRLPLQPLRGVVVTSDDGPTTRVRRQSFSMIQDLDALAEMLREATHRRRMQSALDFFNGLRKRDNTRASAHAHDDGSSLDDSSASSSQIAEQQLLTEMANTDDMVGRHGGGRFRSTSLLPVLDGGK